MLQSIIKYLLSLNPDIIVQCPSRINLINPLDAVEGDFWMPSVAINGIKNPLSAFCYIKNSNNLSKIRIYKRIKDIENNCFEIEVEEELCKEIKEIKKKFDGELKLIYASIYRFCKTNSFFWNKFLEQEFEIGILTTIPRQSGLGGSAAIIISILYCFAKFFNLYNNFSCLRENDFPINKDIIAEMATKVEDEDLKITAGYSDRYVICRGGLCFCSYYGKLQHKEISMEPLAIYDRIDITYNISDLPIILCFSGSVHESGDVHKKLREKYLQNEPEIIYYYQKLAELSWKSRFTLMRHNWKQLGRIFNENTKIMNHVMKDVGFEHGIGLFNKIVIKLIEDHPDVFSVKLTGAGGGGSVFALVNPKNIQGVMRDWKNNLNEVIKNERSFKAKFPNYPSEIRFQLQNAEFYLIKINKNGVSRVKNNKQL
jgi:galactokinase/mevalonate kinase-like predicted kinase